MGYYINTDSSGRLLSRKDSAGALILDGAKLTDPSFKENLICVVDNGMFEAAAFIFSEKEFHDFNDPADRRRKWWLVHPQAASLSGYQKQTT